MLERRRGAQPLSDQLEMERAHEHLTGLGFTAMEADVYIALLQESPATGYRVAAYLGKAPANTYKALRSLTDKGAVLNEDGDGRLYQAVPVKELLNRCMRQFQSRHDAAYESLKDIGQRTTDTSVYRLHRREQVMERAREMIGRAREVVLATGFPGPITELSPDLAAAAARGVDVGVKSYASIEIAGVDFVESSESAYWQKQSPGEELQLVVDAEEHLLALLVGSDVLQAIWSASPFLGYLHHNSVELEHTVTRVARAFADGADLATVRGFMKVRRHPVDTPGYRALERAIKALDPARGADGPAH